MQQKLSQYIKESLESKKHDLRNYFLNSGKIRHFYLDDVLPNDVAEMVSSVFPDLKELKHNKTIRENKFIGVNLDGYNPIVKDLLFAFQDQEILNIISEITNIKDLQRDTSFYAAGISGMTKDCYLNPHLDNSHNADRSMYRALNILYYAEKDWKIENGGNLEIWPNGVKKGDGLTIFSKFNRLAVMETNNASWHSVSPITSMKGIRKCYSNYYFTKQSPVGKEYFNVTTFRARPENKLQNIALMLDGALRNVIRKIKKRNVKKIEHIYK